MGDDYSFINTIGEPIVNDPIGYPHPSAWNIGGRGNAISNTLNLKLSEANHVIVCKYVDLWDYNTPFGRPVVPLVYDKIAPSSSWISGNIYFVEDCLDNI